MEWNTSEISTMRAVAQRDMDTAPYAYEAVLSLLDALEEVRADAARWKLRAEIRDDAFAAEMAARLRSAR